jgi:carbamoyltransferase
MTIHKSEPLFLLRHAALHRMTMQYHPHIGQLYIPNLRARIPNELGGYYVTSNSQGFRSDVEFRAERGHRPRILFFGDSFTDGFGVSNHERFTDWIGHALDVEVYNYGLTGSGTDQQLLIYEHYARGVAADLIVIGVMVENIQRIVRSHHRSIDRYSNSYVYLPKPYFTLENGGLENGALVLHHSPVPKERFEQEPDGFETIEKRIEPAWHRFLHGLRRLYYRPELASLRKARPASILQNDLFAHFLRKANFQPYEAYLSVESPGWQLMEAILRRWLAQVAPTPVLIVPIPDSFFYRSTALEPIYQQRFESLADPGRNVHVADITTPINELPPEERARLPFQHDFHFSPYGNGRVAQIIGNEILKRNLLPAAGQRERPFTLAVNGEKRTPSSQTYILGISCFYHNAAACLIHNGQLVAAAEEERFSRIKHDRNFPHRAVNYCLEEAGIQQSDLAAVVYYDNAYQTFERLIHTQVAVGQAGEEAWLRVVPSWLQYKLTIPALIRRNLKYDGLILQEMHHRSHAASAFYPSPFERAAILTVDGVGEWATAAISVGDGRQIRMIKELHFPHSLGLLYSAFTQFIGFKVNDGEYKMMGLAPYGEPQYVDLIRRHLVDIKEDGSMALNMDYFAFLSEPAMTNGKFAALFGGPARHPDEPITQRERDIARSIQVITEEIILKMARHAHELTGEKYLCLAGGVALNCVANGRLLREGPFDDIWIQPAAGDAGCALGAAFDVWHTYLGQERSVAVDGRSPQAGSLWGPDYSAAEIQGFLDTFGYPYHRLTTKERAEHVARYMEEGKVVGHFAGRLEYGPRALGSRSIIGDARNQEMQTTLNLKIKYRESFRPFAPAVLAERVGDYFELDRESPYMLLVAQVRPDRCRQPEPMESENLFEIVRQARSDIPAITHVDYSARIQTIHRADHPGYYDAINCFAERTGYGVIVNTSFNVRGEPIVCSPYDAYRCFMRTEMDVLLLGDFLLLKEEQPPSTEEKGHMEKYDPEARLEPVGGPAIEALRRFFHQEFLPVAAQLSQAERRVGNRTATEDTYWVRCLEAPAPERIFEISHALQQETLPPAPAAADIVRFWAAGPAREQLRPVVEKLLRLGQEKFAVEAEQEVVEEVPEFVYALY